MSFWTQASLEPRRNFRFKLLDGDDETWWWAKSVDKPSFDISNNEYQLINHKFKYPGIVTWKPITITVADIGNRTYPLLGELTMMGYSHPPAGVAHKGLEKLMTTTPGGANINGVTIKQLDDAGAPAETWKLYGAFITSVSFSKLDYSNDDIAEITIEVAYDFATLS
tara:strand:- start:30 stop:530 length:501 start_codon:yes stop_codon:yes gene_type:complete